ncbi:hypothetical protein QN277_005782 [Acacia crassicarpa]|uniref:Disease resistance N-terminal domain-containing protein n=1 Tax=Acacia crassicarpa TaxID=499986 RepID=A0AAE1IZW1_9FABA|nr:hypothetical protein QN277_005782 [Acacia crassicarpa]
MAELLGGSLLFAFLQVMFNRIAFPNVVAFLDGKKSIEKSLQRLKTTLYAAGAVLHDTDRKQITDSAVKSWLDDLRDAIYRADDLIDEISSQAETRVEHKYILGLRDVVGRETLSWRHQSTSLVDEFDVFGRENEKEAILELLLSDDDGGESIVDDGRRTRGAVREERRTERRWSTIMNSSGRT